MTASEVFGDLASQVTAALRHPAPERLLGDLELRYPHLALVTATRTAASQPVWSIDWDTPVGLVTGSGGAGLRLPHVSTLAAFVASCVPGVTVVKSGSAGSRRKDGGSTRCANDLGLPVAHTAAELRAALRRHRFAVVSTESAYPWLYSPQIFTFPFIVEALDSTSFTPCPVSWKVNGVVEGDLERHRARYQSIPGMRVLLVLGQTDQPGTVFDEASTAGTTIMMNIEPTGETRTWSVEPEDVGLRRMPLSRLLVPTGEDTAYNGLQILRGESKTPHTELVAFNAGTILFHAGAAPDLRIGYLMASALLADGTAAQRLGSLRDAHERTPAHDRI